MCAHVLRVKTFRMNGLLSPIPRKVYPCVPQSEMSLLALPCYHSCDLDYRINMCLGENAFSTCTFDIEAEDPEGCERRPLSFGRMGNKCVPAVNIPL